MRAAVQENGSVTPGESSGVDRKVSPGFPCQVIGRRSGAKSLHGLKKHKIGA
jgi:hypothetical protein